MRDKSGILTASNGNILSTWKENFQKSYHQSYLKEGEDPKATATNPLDTGGEKIPEAWNRSLICQT